jgi:hypothetical protein
VRRIFCDMDGVLADFERGYKEAFGIECSKLLDNVDWDLVRSKPDFYETLPPMPDCHVLWNYIKHTGASLLTGVPQRLLGDANTQKHRWAYRVLGPSTHVICELSKDKSKHCQPGDILIDDWTKYQHLWEATGGVFVHHTSAMSTIAQLMDLGVKGERTW